MDGSAARAQLTAAISMPKAKRASTSPARRASRSPARARGGEEANFECSTCLQLLVAPVTLRCCGGSVCRHCLVRHLESSYPHDARCPACGTNARLTADDARSPSVALRTAIERACPEYHELRMRMMPAADHGAQLEERIAALLERPAPSRRNLAVYAVFAALGATLGAAWIFATWQLATYSVHGLLCALRAVAEAVARAAGPSVWTVATTLVYGFLGVCVASTMLEGLYSILYGGDMLEELAERNLECVRDLRRRQAEARERWNVAWQEVQEDIREQGMGD